LLSGNARISLAVCSLSVIVPTIWRITGNVLFFRKKCYYYQQNQSVMHDIFLLYLAGRPEKYAKKVFLEDKNRREGHKGSQFMT
jgi:hypothetical protein